jgi:DNA-binding CsgD family transcriptional regulator
MEFLKLWGILKRISSPELLFEKWKSVSLEALDNYETIDNSYLFENIELIEHFSSESNMVVGVFDVKSLTVKWHTDNIEPFFGYTNEEFKKQGMLLVFKGLRLSHKLFLFQNILFGIKLYKKATPTDRKEYVGFQNFGLRAINPKTGVENAFFIRQYCIKYDENSNPLLYLSIIENCTHLVNGNEYWGRIEIGKTNKLVHHFYSNDFRSTEGDLLSNREYEILDLLNKGNDSHEIAEKLFISPHTVDKHRKNMVRKTGAKNTLALLQIAKMCKMV